MDQEVDQTIAQQPRRVSPFAWPLIGIVRLYQLTLSPLLGRHCRFQPTCSHYSVEALQTHGAARGSWLTVRRILRCHPFGGCGFDPVPARKHINATRP